MDLHHLVGPTFCISRRTGHAVQDGERDMKDWNLQLRSAAVAGSALMLVSWVAGPADARPPRGTAPAAPETAAGAANAARGAKAVAPRTNTAAKRNDARATSKRGISPRAGAADAAGKPKVRNTAKVRPNSGPAPSAQPGVAKGPTSARPKLAPETAKSVAKPNPRTQAAGAKKDAPTFHKKVDAGQAAAAQKKFKPKRPAASAAKTPRGEPTDRP